MTALGRNETCHCGSGKKYKKCCLEKDAVEARAQAAAARAAADERLRAAEEARAAELAERQEEALDATEPGLEEPEPAEPPPRPALRAKDQALVDAWWKEVEPVYMLESPGEQWDWLHARALAFLEEHPQLFRHLGLQEEFLPELAAHLARTDRYDLYVALLRRFRDEQPEMYSECFVYWDLELLTAALHAGRSEEIPTCLALFREQPLKDISLFATVVDLLAWQGRAAELSSLLEPTASLIANSPDVSMGEFGLHWLTCLRLFAFFEGGDDSPEALQSLEQDLSAIGFVELGTREARQWLERTLQIARGAAADAEFDPDRTQDKWFVSDMSWSYTGWVCRAKGLPWSTARFLGNGLMDYWGWLSRKRKHRKSTPRNYLGLDADLLESYVRHVSQGLNGLPGIRTMSVVQAFHYLTDYMAARGRLAAHDVARLQSHAQDLFRLLPDLICVDDPARRLCPTYETLIAGPRAPRTDP